MKVTIEVNEVQARLIQKSLDLYSRLTMGQFNEIHNVMSGYSKYWMDYYNTTIVLNKLEEVRNIVYPELKNYAHWGISNDKCPEVSRIAYDMIQVIRYELYKAYDGNKKTYSIDSNPPLKFSKEEELCNVIIEK